MRIGIIGFGFIAERGHSPYYMNNDSVQVVGIADFSAARLKEAAKCFPKAILFSSAHDMFCALEANIDVVDICTPPYNHFSLITEALCHGYHVICEKPLVTEIDQIAILLDQSRAKKRIIYPCHNYRFSVAVCTAKELIAQNQIGIPQRISIHTYRFGHAKGVVDWMPDWRRNKKYSSGGILMDHGPHSLYLASYFLETMAATRVSCTIGNILADDFDTEDTVQLEVIYDQGQQASIYLSWAASYRTTKYLIIGTSGYIEIDNDVVTVTNGKGCTIQDSRAQSSNPSHYNWYSAMFSEFQSNCSASDGFLRIGPLLEASFVAAVISAAYTSATMRGTWTSVESV